MACFIVPAAEAVITAAAHKCGGKHPFAEKLKWLRNLSAGGAVLLAFEHMWHGEVTPWFPFLTAAADSAETADMLQEMATTGVGMALAVTLVWLGMVAVSVHIEKRADKAVEES